ncbi:hypothetical protein FA95DRAFT_1564248 [Auriscalpium vulgare]|uniref:Uncharacterized protein n=1 Tax=Auriscalpium vulgare TaxID=40419 RepID=A0ACB8RFY8_9AGAM|nr:hypothetical protein FA95DRAFT_1564248 [Auriscalpium vulgare]
MNESAMFSQFYAAAEALRKVSADPQRSIARARNGHVFELRTITFHISRFPNSLFRTAELV